MATCKSCGADIIWVRFGTGKTMPVDFAPSADGNISIATKDGLALVISERHRTPDMKLHKSHFATCPNAKQHRRPK